MQLNFEIWDRSGQIDLKDLVIDSTWTEDELIYTASSSDENVSLDVDGTLLNITPSELYEETVEITVSVEDKCAATSDLAFSIQYGTGSAQ